MPRQDGTGPTGEGANTGRGEGPCSGDVSNKKQDTFRSGGGRGTGGGRGGGGGGRGTGGGRGGRGGGRGRQ